MTGLNDITAGGKISLIVYLCMVTSIKVYDQQNEDIFTSNICIQYR